LTTSVIAIFSGDGMVCPTGRAAVFVRAICLSPRRGGQRTNCETK
jgi:hypothetical protein